VNNIQIFISSKESDLTGNQDQEVATMATSISDTGYTLTS